MALKDIATKLAIPASVVLTYIAVRKTKMSDTKKVGFTVGAGLLTFLVSKAVTGQKSNIQEAAVKETDLPIVHVQPDGSVIRWNPDPLSKEIAENLEGVNLFTYPETTNKILVLQDEQVKALYNHYNKYYSKDYATLTKLIDNEWDDWEGSYNKAVVRLRSLGLN